jgi:hypothetical protein
VSRFSGPQRRGADRLERIRRAVRAITRQLDTAEREHTEITESERDCE